MPGDHRAWTTRSTLAAPTPTAGPGVVGGAEAALAVHFVSQAVAEHSALAEFEHREQLLAATSLVGYRSARTRAVRRVGACVPSA